MEGAGCVVQGVGCVVEGEEGGRGASSIQWRITIVTIPITQIISHLETSST